MLYKHLIKKYVTLWETIRHNYKGQSTDRNEMATQILLKRKIIDRGGHREKEIKLRMTDGDVSSGEQHLEATTTAGCKKREGLPE